jgi:multidrug efflux pump subunit AcrB
MPAVAVNVIKQGSANALDLAEACDDVIAELTPQMRGVTIVRAASQAPYIREASRATLEALGLALLLAILVIWPFLHDWKPTLISALAVPTVLLGTAFIMKLLHFNLETITLLALALVVGVIVDDQIVAVENIVRHIEDGETPRQSAYRANREIGRTMVACSLTVVAVFLPIGLMTGTLGQFFKPFGLTASAAVLLSLLAARSLSPTLAAAWLRTVLRPRKAARPDIRHLHYRRVIAWALTHRAAVVAIAVVAFAAGLTLIPFIPKGFIPHLDRGEFHVTFGMPLGTSLSDMVATAKTLEDSVKQDPAVSDVYTTIGGQSGTSTGLLDVHLKANRKVKTIDVEDAVRTRLPPLDGVDSSVGDVPFVGTDTSKPLQFYFVGNNLNQLRALGREFEHRLQQTKGFVDVTASGLSDGTPFSAIEHVDRKRAVGIATDLEGLELGDANDEVAVLARKLVPKGVSLNFGGTSRDAVTTFRDFGFALALSVAAIIAVLVILFRSWLDPLVISVALPLSTVGALFATWVTHENFGMISIMGLVFLFGLVNKNAILLVDCIKRLRAGGLARYDAILEAGSQRLRPIVMTTAALILGMAPIALGFGAGAELRAPMAVSIIGGLITSTVLSLVVVPVVYTLVDDLRERVRRKPA